MSSLSVLGSAETKNMAVNGDWSDIEDMEHMSPSGAACNSNNSQMESKSEIMILGTCACCDSRLSLFQLLHSMSCSASTIYPVNRHSVSKSNQLYC